MLYWLWTGYKRSVSSDLPEKNKPLKRNILLILTLVFHHFFLFLGGSSSGTFSILFEVPVTPECFRTVHYTVLFSLTHCPIPSRGGNSFSRRAFWGLHSLVLLSIRVSKGWWVVLDYVISLYKGEVTFPFSPEDQHHTVGTFWQVPIPNTANISHLSKGSANFL